MTEDERIEANREYLYEQAGERLAQIRTYSEILLCHAERLLPDYDALAASYDDWGGRPPVKAEGDANAAAIQALRQGFERLVAAATRVRMSFAPRDAEPPDKLDWLTED